jgi:hypothetical protein
MDGLTVVQVLMMIRFFHVLTYNIYIYSILESRNTEVVSLQNEYFNFSEIGNQTQQAVYIGSS